MRKTTQIKTVPLLAAIAGVWLLYVCAQWWFVGWIMKDNGHVQMHKWVSYLSPWESFFLIVICYPIIEELIFRLPLRPTPLNIVIGLLVGVWFSLFRTELDTLVISIDSGLGIRFVLGLFLGLFLIWTFVKGYFDWIAVQLTSLKKWQLIVFSALVFALTHLGKIDYDSWIYAGAFIIVIYFTHGLFFGFVRMKLNIWVAIAFHVATNSIPYVLTGYFSIIRNENLFKYL